MKSALLPLLLCFPLLAQDAPTMTLTYKDGDSCSAQLVALKGDEVKLKVFVLGGSMQITRKLDDFAPLSAYAIQLQAHKPETFDDHFAMAKRAVDGGLVPQAGDGGAWRRAPPSRRCRTSRRSTPSARRSAPGPPTRSRGY